MSSVVKKSFQLFSFRTLKNYPELTPLVGIIGFAGVMCGAFCVYAAYQKPDVMINRSSRTFPWDKVNPEEKQKFLGHQQYRSIPEKEQLYKEIGVYKF